MANLLNFLSWQFYYANRLGFWVFLHLLVEEYVLDLNNLNLVFQCLCLFLLVVYNIPRYQGFVIIHRKLYYHYVLLFLIFHVLINNEIFHLSLVIKYLINPLYLYLDYRFILSFKNLNIVFFIFIFLLFQVGHCLVLNLLTFY